MKRVATLRSSVRLSTRVLRCKRSSSLAYRHRAHTNLILYKIQCKTKWGGGGMINRYPTCSISNATRKLATATHQGIFLSISERNRSEYCVVWASRVLPAFSLSIAIVRVVCHNLPAAVMSISHVMKIAEKMKRTRRGNLLTGCNGALPPTVR